MEDRVLHSHLGKMGLVLKDFANGLDDSPVRLEHTHAPVKSIGNSTTTSRDLLNDEDVQIVFYLLAESVAARLRENGFQCKVVEISVRDNGLYHFSRQRKLDHVTNITSELAEVAFSIFKSNYAWEKPIRSLGLRGCDLVVGNVDEQLSLFVDIEYQDKLRKMDEAVDDIRRRFGYFSVQRGLMYYDKSLSSLDCKESHVVHPHSYF